ncbi:hypothetical protein ILUMI_08163 [Ignelater luminosus]|uniref:Uncharacterized protein n=1 Tax=Ignelater luminosus TaxID=2038154 RepID=A0A8K0D831_IGNLU|nr:hypothetical protein ILUMI_08163 [Ignelater luminosus]
MQAVEDADSTVISNAFQLGRQSGTAVIVVGEDVDLLIFLTAATPVSSRTYFLKPGKGKQADMFYSLSGFGGYDSTSAMFGQGKLKRVKTLEKHIHLQEGVAIFSKPDGIQDEVKRTSQKFIVTLYSDSSKMSLNEIRYGIFSTALVKKEFNLASLSPSEVATPQHSL